MQNATISNNRHAHISCTLSSEPTVAALSSEAVTDARGPVCGGVPPCSPTRLPSEQGTAHVPSAVRRSTARGGRCASPEFSVLCQAASPSWACGLGAVSDACLCLGITACVLCWNRSCPASCRSTAVSPPTGTQVSAPSLPTWGCRGGVREKTGAVVVWRGRLGFSGGGFVQVMCSLERGLFDGELWAELRALSSLDQGR